MEIFFLSLIQGISEFLPISSSAHIFITSKVFHFSEMTRAMEVALNTMTLSVIIVYFRNDLWSMTKGFFSLFSGRVTPAFHEGLKICTAVLPVVVAGYFVHSYADHFVHNIKLIGWMAILFGTIMIFVDRICRNQRKISQLSYNHSFIIGLFQTLSLIPGVSRSGSTLIGARLLGYHRLHAARFSFLMSIPVGLGAVTLTVAEVMKTGYFAWGIDLITISFLVFMIGYITLSFFMKWLQKHTLLIWGFYRIFFGLFILYYLA